MFDWFRHHQALAPFLDGVLAGTALTVFATCVGFVFGMGLAIGLLAARLSGFRLLQLLVMTYVSAIRGTPALLHMLIAYYVVPTLLGVSISPLAAGILALACNTSAYLSEILRASLSTIPTGQAAAARALGMRGLQVWRHILLPQMLYRAVPPLTNEFTMLLKASSLMSVIAVGELATVARNATLQSDLPLQVFSAAAAVYFVILFSVSTLSRRLERRLAKVLPHAD